jgi:hypothetical protein
MDFHINPHHRTWEQQSMKVAAFKISNSTRVFIFLFCFILLPSHLMAQDASLKNLVVANTEHDFLLYFRVENGFTSELEKGLHSGIPITFTFFIVFSEGDKTKVLKELSSDTFEHTLTYNNLKEEYSLEFSENSARTETTQSLDIAKRMLAHVNGFKLYELTKLDCKRDYVIKVKARLSEKSLPDYVQYLIPFWSSWDFETDWNLLEFNCKQ